MENQKDTTENNFIDEINITEDKGIIKKVFNYGLNKENVLPEEGQEIIAHYKGTLEDGTVFDSSYNRQEPFKFILGKGQVIKGWDMGFATMKKGERALLICQPEYAYGENGSPPAIPPNSILHFEVELINFYDKKKEKWEMSDEEKQIEANKLKVEGNSLFKESKYNEAYHIYKEGFDYISDIDNNEIKLNYYLNLSICANKINNWRESNEYSESALEIDQNNIKALYRKGIAESNLDNNGSI